MHENEIVLPKDIMIVSEADSKSSIIFANEDFCKISGYSIKEVIGKPHNIVRHKDMPKAAFKDLWTTLKAGKTWKGIVKNQVKNGGFYWVNATVFPSKTPDGEIRYVSIRIKPTKKEIEAAQKFYASLL